MIQVVLSKFTDRKILVSKFGHNKARSLAEIEQIRQKIKNETITNLYSLSQTDKNDLFNLADNALKGKTYPVKTAYDFLEVHRNGVRETYEDKYHAHRLRLSLLVVGQLLENENSNSTNKYLNEIANGVWIMCEESTWAYPAHIGFQLPSPGSNNLELNGGEAAKTLAWVKLLLGDQLDHISPVISRRIDYELRRRVFEAFLNQNYWWESFQQGHSSMNWNIWINSNIIKSALFTLSDINLFGKVLNKTIYSGSFLFSVSVINISIN